MHYFAGVYKKSFARPEDLARMRTKGSERTAQFIEGNFGFIFGSSGQDLLSDPSFFPGEDRGPAVIFEGIISNRLELIKTLSKKRGLDSVAHFISRLYQERGQSFFPDLKGNFCFALWDRGKNELILCSDKLGLHPIYYHQDREGLVFGSFLEQILNDSRIKKEVDHRWLSRYLFMDGLTLGEDTEFAGIKKLRPGHVLTFNGRSSSLQKIDYKEMILPRDLSEKETISQFAKLLSKVLQRQFSSAKIQIAFSGGLDTYILALAAKNFGLPVQALTVEFDSLSPIKKLDYQTARERASLLKMEHHRIRLSPERFLEEVLSAEKWPHLINFNNLNGFYFLRSISKYGNRVFTGDGTEEQLSFYQHQIFPYLADRLLPMVPPGEFERLREELLRIYGDLFFVRSWQFGDRELKKKLKAKIFSPRAGKKIAGYNETKTFFDCLAETRETDFIQGTKGPAPSFFNQALWMDLHNNLAPKMAASYGLASRLYSIDYSVPFMDEDLVSYASALPASLKLPVWSANYKFILREAAKELKLANSEEVRPVFKSGSDIPFEEWLLSPVFEKFVKETLSPKRTAQSGIFNPSHISQLLKEHYHQKNLSKKKMFYGTHLFKEGQNHTQKILKLLGFQLWWERNFK